MRNTSLLSTVLDKGVKVVLDNPAARREFELTTLGEAAASYRIDLKLDQVSFQTLTTGGGDVTGMGAFLDTF